MFFYQTLTGIISHLLVQYKIYTKPKEIYAKNCKYYFLRMYYSSLRYYIGLNMLHMLNYYSRINDSIR
jgi:hypothetical protein